MNFLNFILNTSLRAKQSMIFGFLSLVFLAACADIGERDNPLDPESDNYIADVDLSSDSEEDLSSSSEKYQADTKKSSSSEKSQADTKKSSSSEKSQKESSSSEKSQDTQKSSSSSAEELPNSSADEIESSASAVPPSSSATVASSSSVSTWTCGDSTIVRDGVEYKTVEIADMCFMKENMRFKPGLGNSICYGEDDANCETYGRLYDYEAASYACPSGWRMPTADEYEILIDFYNKDDENTVGKHFKATSGWSDANGDDDLEFTALPGGICDEDKECSGLGDYGYWWTSSVAKKNYSHYALNLTAFNDQVTAKSGIENERFLSVRCVKD